MRELLKPFGAEKNQAYVAILEWFAQNRDRRVNENELALMGFKRFKKGQRVWVTFSAATISRSARKLGEWELLERGHDSAHHTWYSMPSEGLKQVKAASVRYEPMMDANGRMYVKEIRN